jgi:pimeloyl-ACP methyl ester carboxylesterase
LLVLASLFAIVVVGYAIAVLWLLNEESSLVFEAGRTLGAGRPSLPYEQVDIRRADGARQFAWIMRHGRSDDGVWALFLHGNASTIASNVSLAHYRELRAIGLNILAPEYRGFGGLDGVPREAELDADVRAAYDELRTVRHIPAERIVVYGWSLGSALAVTLASRTDQAAVILEGAPTSQASISERRYPFFPVRFFARSRFDSIGKIARVRTPLLFLHSPEDAVVPLSEGRRLFEAARGDKTFVELPGGHLNAADADPAAFADAIRAFLTRHGLSNWRP